MANDSYKKFLEKVDSCGASEEMVEILESFAEDLSRSLVEMTDGKEDHILKGRLFVCYELIDSIKSALADKESKANGQLVDGIPDFLVR